MLFISKEDLERKIEQIHREKVYVLNQKQLATEKLSRRGLTPEYRRTLLEHLRLLVTMEQRLQELEEQCRIMIEHLNHTDKWQLNEDKE